MKKLIALLLAVLMLASLLTACSGKTEQEEPAADNEVMTETQPEPVTPETEKEPEGKPESERPSATPETQPEVKPEVQPAAKPEAKPEVQPEAKPEQEETPVIGETENVQGEVVEDVFSALGGELYSIMDSIYASYPNFPAELMLGTIPVDLTDAGSLSYFTGLTDASKVKEAIVSEPMMGSQPYSVVMVRLNDAADALSVAEAMRDGIDQRKWVCVEADVLRVVACEDLVLLVMIGSNLDGLSVDTMIETFGTICGKAFSVDLKK